MTADELSEPGATEAGGPDATCKASSRLHSAAVAAAAASASASSLCLTVTSSMSSASSTLQLSTARAARSLPATACCSCTAKGFISLSCLTAASLSAMRTINKVRASVSSTANGVSVAIVASSFEQRSLSSALACSVAGSAPADGDDS